MHSLSQTQKNHIFSLLDAHHSVQSVASITLVHPSTISRLRSKHCPTIKKSLGGRPAKLSPANIHYTVYLITSQKAENAVQVNKELCNVERTSMNPNTVCRCLKKHDMKAVVKKKHPFLLAKHHKHQEDDTLLGATWCDLAQLGVFGRIGDLGKYAKTCQLRTNSPQVSQAVRQVHQSTCQLQCHFDWKTSITWWATPVQNLLSST